MLRLLQLAQIFFLALQTTAFIFKNKRFTDSSSTTGNSHDKIKTVGEVTNFLRCSPDKIGPEQYDQTKLLKILDNFPKKFTPDLEIFNSRTAVCSLKWVNRGPSNLSYNLKTFPNKTESLKNGYQITHKGKCGGCSNLKSLKLYMSTPMTNPVRKCGIKGFWSPKVERRCMKKVGFEGDCLEAWIWNLGNTAKECKGICLKQLFLRNNKKDGSLNACLQCDEDKSGPQFKYMSGRTRRNSGLESEIQRGEDEIAELDICY